MDRCRFRIAGALLLVMAAALPAQGQVPMSPRAVGMSGALVGTARGVDALFLNPANLALPGSPVWSLGLPQATLTGTLAGPTFSDLADLLDRGSMSPAEKDRIFSSIPARGAEARLDARVPLLSYQRNRLAFGVSYAAVGEHGVSRDVFELALYGYQDGRIDYGAEGTAGSRMTFLDFAVAYGDRIGPVSWGVTGHYLRGRTLLRSWVTDPRFDLAGLDIDAEYVSVFLRGGNGFALDVGAAYQPVPGVTLSAAIANAIGRLSWSDEMHIRNVNLNRTSVEEDFGDLLDRHKASERPVGPADAALVQGVTARSLEDQGYLPTTARLGLGWQPADRTHLGLSYYGAITGGGMGGTWDRMLGIGIEQRIPLLTLRTGYATNFDQGSMFSGGVTLGVLEIGVARVNDGPFDTASRRGWVAAAGMTVRTGLATR
jgi:hypothetical protein